MKTRILVAILAAAIGMVLAHVPPAQPHRIGPAGIYPDPVRTPGSANPEVPQRNIGDTPFLLPCLPAGVAFRIMDFGFGSEAMRPRLNFREMGIPPNSRLRWEELTGTPAETCLRRPSLSEVRIRGDEIVV
jgi:hypothetical protein